MTKKEVNIGKTTTWVGTQEIRFIIYKVWVLKVDQVTLKTKYEKQRS